GAPQPAQTWLRNGAWQHFLCWPHFHQNRDAVTCEGWVDDTLGRALSMRYEPKRSPKNSAKPSATMLPFSYRCPDCGWNVETLVPEVTSGERDVHQSTVCPNCQQLHSVNPANGEILVEDGLGDPWQLSNALNVCSRG